MVHDGRNLEIWVMVPNFLFPLLSSGQPIFDAIPWKMYQAECTEFIMADSDNTDGSRKIRAGQASLTRVDEPTPYCRLIRRGCLLTGPESMHLIARLHRLILHQTAPLSLRGRDPSAWSYSPDPYLK